MAAMDEPERLTRLEEHLGYAERSVEQLSAEIAELNKRMKTLADRLARLEIAVAKGRGEAEKSEPD